MADIEKEVKARLLAGREASERRDRERQLRIESEEVSRRKALSEQEQRDTEALEKWNRLGVGKLLQELREVWQCGTLRDKDDPVYRKLFSKPPLLYGEEGKNILRAIVLHAEGEPEYNVLTGVDKSYLSSTGDDGMGGGGYHKGHGKYTEYYTRFPHEITRMALVKQPNGSYEIEIGDFSGKIGIDKTEYQGLFSRRYNHEFPAGWISPAYFNDKHLDLDQATPEALHEILVGSTVNRIKWGGDIHIKGLKGLNV